MLFYVIVAVLVIVAISVTIFIVRLERREVRGSFPLIHAQAPVVQAIAPQPQRGSVPANRTNQSAPASAAPIAAAPAAAAPVALVPVAPVPVTRTPVAPAPRRRDDEIALVRSDEPESSPTVRFRRPTEHAMQLLPGRLEVVAGEPGYKEIRLVRVPGERPEVILGREVGESPGYIALHSTTVSRRHARLAYANGTWTVANLSQTNPVVVNDQALAASHGERTLADGDCLELGEVVLRFHAQ